MSDLVQFAVVLAAALVAVYYTGHGPYLLRKTSELAYGKPGCSPVPAIGNVTIHYFDIRGRAEVIRLMLEEAQIPYNETKFTEKSWPAAKIKGIEDGLYTFGQVPAITTTKGFQLVQSHAIAHYIGRSTGMECDCEDLHFCDVVSQGVEDFRQKMGKVVYDVDFSAEKRNDYFDNIASTWLDHFEKIAPCIQAQDKTFFASDRLTWIDFLVFDLLDNNVEFSKVKMAGVRPVDVLEKYPRLSSFYNQFIQRPNLVAYLQNRSPFKLPYMPKVNIPVVKKSEKPKVTKQVPKQMPKKVPDTQQKPKAKIETGKVKTPVKQGKPAPTAKP
ncbi:glutathione S-transferase P 1-like [Saccoglossus kowalevskii]|uniref:Glutathione S-transferase P 1-like n=1 Tax=Saccoglossus kowalevskii TaxID=10224 RepID=A0ABM0M535_SACKO|nr:PREDICTED: glutathione S-transferase P 1-like [Saccoglossus kowalevskii]